MGGGAAGAPGFGGFNIPEGTNPDDLIARSPFGPLLELPGVDGAEDLFGGLAPPGAASDMGVL
jgi:hypothetical protein